MALVTKGVYFIKGQDEMIPDSHVYVIGDPSSKDLSIIDVGLAGKGRYKINSLLKEGLDLLSIRRIILTHTHFDHIGCIGEIKKEIPHAEIWVHRAEGELLEKGDDRAVYGMDMFKEMCTMQYGIKRDAFRMKVDRMLEGGEVLEIGDMVWEVIPIPGHSMGGIALYSPSHEVLIPGDVIYADYAIGRFDLFGADGKILRESLNRLSSLKIDILLPGHNDIVKGLPDGYVRKVLKMWEPYLM
ncbi:MAG: MBL fold metallo-hydrolase [Syntrophorhabdaceae bacterium]|nr:MBL fold metallo-hydrolase [Syntrophorhabdaceae bacterium]